MTKHKREQAEDDAKKRRTEILANVKQLVLAVPFKMRPWGTKRITVRKRGEDERVFSGGQPVQHDCITKYTCRWYVEQANAAFVQ